MILISFFSFDGIFEVHQLKTIFQKLNHKLSQINCFFFETIIFFVLFMEKMYISKKNIFFEMFYNFVCMYEFFVIIKVEKVKIRRIVIIK